MLFVLAQYPALAAPFCGVLRVVILAAAFARSSLPPRQARFSSSRLGAGGFGLGMAFSSAARPVTAASRGRGRRPEGGWSTPRPMSAAVAWVAATAPFTTFALGCPAGLSFTVVTAVLAASGSRAAACSVLPPAPHSRGAGCPAARSGSGRSPVLLAAWRPRYFQYHDLDTFFRLYLYSHLFTIIRYLLFFFHLLFFFVYVVCYLGGGCIRVFFFIVVLFFLFCRSILSRPRRPPFFSSLSPPRVFSSLLRLFVSSLFLFSFCFLFFPSAVQSAGQHNRAR